MSKCLAKQLPPARMVKYKSQFAFFYVLVFAAVCGDRCGGDDVFACLNENYGVEVSPPSDYTDDFTEVVPTLGFFFSLYEKKVPLGS